MRWLVVVLALAGVAHADDKTKAVSEALATAVNHLASGTWNDELPQIILYDGETKLHEELVEGPDGAPSGPLHTVVGLAADGHAAWVAADSGAIIVCGMEGCDKILRDAQRRAERDPTFHITAIVEDGKVLLLHVGSTGKGVGFGDMDAGIAPDTEPVVALFQKSIADPKTFAATIADRKDVVLYGTEATERFVGGAAARATLARWNLSLAVHGNLRTGIVKSKTVAWIAADVEARSPKSKTPTPYRLTVIYEKTGADWKIVQLHFS